MTSISEILDFHLMGRASARVLPHVVEDLKKDLEAHYTERFNKAIGDDEDLALGPVTIGKNKLRAEARKRWDEDK